MSDNSPFVFMTWPAVGTPQWQPQTLFVNAQTWRGMTFEPTPHETLSLAQAAPELNGVEPQACVSCGTLSYALYGGCCEACTAEPDEDEDAPADVIWVGDAIANFNVGDLFSTSAGGVALYVTAVDRAYGLVTLQVLADAPASADNGAPPQDVAYDPEHPPFFGVDRAEPAATPEPTSKLACMSCHYELTREKLIECEGGPYCRYCHHRLGLRIEK